MVSDGADDTRELIRRALARDPASVRTLVGLLSPVIERRVAATLWQRTSRRSAQQELKDLTQAVFVSLFEDDGKALRAWDPARGASLEGFVSLLAHRQVISTLRRGRTTPWPDEPTEEDRLDAALAAEAASTGSGGANAPDALVGTREHLTLLLDRLRLELSPVGLEIFERLVVDEEPVEDLSRHLGKSVESLYQWRSRLIRRVRTLSAEILAVGRSETSGARRITGEP